MKVVKTLLPFALIIVVWEFLILFSVIDRTFFPGPLETLGRLGQLLSEKDFIEEVLASFYRLSAGTLLSIILSVALCYGCFRIKIVNDLITPVIGFTFPLPKVAVMPLLMLIFGIGDGYKIAVIFLGMFFLLFINIQKSSLWLQKSSLSDVCQIYNIRGMAYFQNVFLKGLWLDFLVGLKAAMGYGLTLVVVSEFTASKNGIGNFIWKAWDQFRILDLYAAIYLLCFLGLVIYSGLDYFIKRHSVLYKQY